MPKNVEKNHWFQRRVREVAVRQGLRGGSLTLVCHLMFSVFCVIYRYYPFKKLKNEDRVAYWRANPNQ
jgi:hypothetical protein